MGIIAQLIDIAKKKTTWNKQVEIYNNGDDNQYPERIERLINNSVTAKMASGIMTQYLVGKGLGETDNLIVNKFKNTKLIDFLNRVAKNKVNQKGVFIHVNWNANFKIKDLQVLPFNTCRVGKIDDKDYNGKILVHKDWLGKAENPNIIDVYNPDATIIEAQVRFASGNKNKTLTADDWNKYKGQILFVNDDYELIYPLSKIDAVSLDCDNEYLISVYKNRILRNGFFGKTLVITRPLIDKDVEKTIYENGELVRNPKYFEAESERDAFNSTIKQFLGAENVDGVMSLEIDFDHENLENAIVIKNIESNIDPDMFEKIEVSIRKNILIAFNNLPVGLVQASEGIFSNSADALIEMKKTYWENTQLERDSLQTLVNDLLARFEGYAGGYLEVKPIIENALVDNDGTKKAQEELKGSVGGVTSLLAIQQSVAMETTTYNSGVAMLMNIYGYSEEVAKKMLGNPKIEKDANGTFN